MMPCVISYWVLSGAPQAADSAAKLLRTHPAKLLKWRNVYLKLTRHNGRAGKHSTYNPKHNDRNFNLTNSEHIDPERAKGNIYWDCFYGFRSALDPQDPDNLAATFSEIEQQFYENRYSEFIEKQNERNAKIRHTENETAAFPTCCPAARLARRRLSTSLGRWTNTLRAKFCWRS